MKHCLGKSVVLKKIAWIISIVLLLVSCQDKKPEETTKPNIVFIFADDLTHTAVHALGNTTIQTPNLDRLVAEGTTFTNAYNMGAWNGAVCVASRAMIISGRSVWDAYAISKEWRNGKQIDQTWGRWMQAAGYETYMTGKWHVDAPADSVFQNVVHVRPGMPSDAWIRAGKGANFTSEDPNALPVGYNRPLSPQDTTWSPTDIKFGGFWEGGVHWSEVLKDDALTFLSKTAQRDKPFFMYLAFNAPHDPRQAPEEFLDMYPIEKMKVPQSFLPQYPYKDSIGNGRDLRDEALAPFPRTEYAIKVHQREYYALISHLDTQIGQLLDGLESTGKIDNTYIIFTADHGLAMGRHGLMGKQSQFDHSIRPPFVLIGPDIPRGQSVGSDIYLQDAMATSLDLAGIEKPEEVFFNSILPLAKGTQTESAYDGIYGAYMNLQRMIRKEGLKLIVYPKLNKMLLFDLERDPEEMNDLSQDSRYKEKKDMLFQALLKQQAALGDSLDLSNME